MSIRMARTLIGAAISMTGRDIAGDRPYCELRMPIAR